jgi:peroxiredoxin
MKRGLLLAGFLVAMQVSLSAQEEVTEVVQFGDKMPSFTIVSDDGAQLSSSVYAGKAVLITFFATWCPSCQLELAEIEKTLWPNMKDREDIAFLAIGREHSDAELAKYNEKKGFTFPLYPDKNRQIFDAFAVKFIPRTYLVDKSGRIVYIAVGYNQETFKQLQNIIDKTLAE